MKFPQPISYLRLYIGPAVLLALIILLPRHAHGKYEYLIPLAVLCGIYAIIVTGLTLLMGFTGQVSLGHAGFYAVGAYAGAVAVTAFHKPLWEGIAFSILAGALLAFAAGFTILRLKGHYLALATLAIGFIITEVISKMQVTGGAEGLYDIPELKAFGLINGSPLSRVYFVWGVVFLVVLWAVHLTASPAGRALRAIHGDEDAAESLGISAFSVKLKVFAASGVLAALAGVLYTFVYVPGYTSYLGPEEFSLMFSVALVTMVVIGGMGSVWGGLVGAIFFTGIHEVFLQIEEKMNSAGSSSSAVVMADATSTATTNVMQYEELLFGILLIVIMICSRDGMIPGLRSGALRVYDFSRKTLIPTVQRFARAGRKA